MKKVLVVQRRLTHYRLALFNLLREALRKKNIILKLLVGSSSINEKEKRDTGVLEWAEKLPTKYIASACWMPFGSYLPEADLVIVTQENKLLYNHLLLLRTRSFRLSFWGHGRNMQSNNIGGFRERYKSWASRRVDWWFVYTDLSAKNVMDNKFPKDRITVLDNTVDTAGMMDLRESITKKEIKNIKNKLSLNAGPVGIFLGSLYKEKRIEFLMKAALEIRKQLVAFHLLVVGDGPDRPIAERWSMIHPWIHVIGAKHGREKVVLAKTADVLLNPGAVGLGVLDAFVFELPLITTQCGIHGPEIAYLESGRNGIVTPNTKADYVKAVLRVLRERKERELIKAGCRESSQRYTIENMVTHFATGIQRALSAERYLE